MRDAARGSQRRTVLALACLLLSIWAAATTGGAAAAPADRPPSWRDDRLLRGRLMAMVGAMTLEEKVGQLFVTYAYGQSINDPDPAMVEANRSLHGVDDFEQLIRRYHLGGIIYFAFSNNVASPTQVGALSNGIQRVATSERMKVPALIAIDQEQGLVNRILEPATQFPGNMALGAARDPDLAAVSAGVTGTELRAMGINQNLAPVADVNVNPANPVIGVRSYGSEPDLVASLTGAQVRATQRRAIAATAKHFPGHGDTDVDSHTGLPVIRHTDAEVRSIDLPPFQAAVEAGVEAIMTAHIVVPALDPSGRPATLSRPILTGLLRREMGFGGLIVTDALTMEGVRQQFGDARVPVEAIKAGADVLLMPPSIEVAYRAVVRAVRDGEIGEGRINASVYRILRLKHRLGLFEDPFVDEAAIPEVVGNPGHLAAADAVTERTVTLVKNDDGLLPLRPGTGDSTLLTGFSPTALATVAAGLEDREYAAEVFAGGSPSDATIAEAAARAREHDLVLVTTSRAWAFPQQQRLVRELVATGTPTIVVAVRDPYDIAHFTEASTYVATYGFRNVSLRALVRVLFGEIAPAGKLPVTIPPAGAPTGVLYPFGHGLTYG